MIKGSLARRYARAFMSLGQERGIYERLGEEIKTVAELARDEETLRLVIRTPIFSREIRDKVIEKLGESLGFHELTVRFLTFLNLKGRLAYLEQIAQAYQELADEVLGRVRADVVSASPLSDRAGDRLRQALEQLTGKSVLMALTVDPALIGGVVARVDGRLLDGSVATQLQAIEERMKSMSGPSGS